MNFNKQFVIALVLWVLCGCTTGPNKIDKGDSQIAAVHSDTLGEKVNPNRINKLEDISSSLIRASFSGNLIIARGTEVVYREYFGYYNREEGYKYAADTIFDIGSITKQFVATAIMTLVEQGKLTLADTLPVFFKNVPLDKQNITLHHLLTHSSGLPGNFEHQPLYGQMAYAELPQMAFNELLLFDPGTGFQYSNIGYSLLARIIERATGVNWEVFIRDNVLLPAGLTETGYRLPEYNQHRLSINYGADQNYLQRLFNIEARSRAVGHSLAHLLSEPGERWFEGAGAFLSTQGDMFKWYLAILNGDILSPSGWQKVHSPWVAENNSGNWHYGYGWAITRQDNHLLVTHNGSNGYSFAEFNYYPETQTFVFVSTNDIDNYPRQLVQQIYQFALTLPSQ